MRLVFMGTPQFAVPSLEALIEAGHEIAAAYTQPPRPAGRGQKVTPSPVQCLAERHGIPVEHPVSLRSPEAQERFASYEPEAGIVVAYGLLLPKAILETPARGCLNVHPSALPRWRGAAPIQRTIMAGDEETELCIMQMDEGLDTGPVRLREPVVIAPRTTAGELHDEMAHKAGAALRQVLNEWPTAIPQPRDGACYAPKIAKEEARIDWTLDARTLYGRILGLTPQPGAWCERNGERLKLHRVFPVRERGMPGEIIAPFTVACGDGALRIERLQAAGREAVPAAGFFPPLAVGEYLR